QRHLCSKRLLAPLPSVFSLNRSRPPRDRHSFPTRRSSDLTAARGARGDPQGRPPPPRAARRGRDDGPGRRHRRAARGGGGRPCRSEEHTSELQSRGQLVCRLLLQKKTISEKRFYSVNSSRR